MIIATLRLICNFWYIVPVGRKKQKRLIPLIHPTVHVFLALILFLIALLLSRGAEIASWEEPIFTWVYDWPDFLTPLFIVITWFGSVYALGVFSIILFIKQKYNELIRFLMASILAYELSGFAKDLWGRMRPDEVLGIVTRDFSYGPAFPSGHTALATSMAFVAGHYLPKKFHWVVPVWIVSVGISRLYLGLHVPLDIIGGFAIGWFSYMLFRHVRLFAVGYGRKKTKKKRS